MVSSNSYRVLGVYEILEAIVEQLSYRDLSILARVARLISDPCLDVLWKRLPTAFPLLALFSSVIKQNGRYILDPQLSIQSKEWEVFDRYSRRVHFIARQFASSSGGPTDIDFSIFRTLENIRQQSLFPHLRVLSIPTGDMADVTYHSCWNPTVVDKFLPNLAPFIQAKLTRVNILGHYHEDCPLIYEIVKALSKSNSCLHHLRVDKSLDSQVFRLLQHFPRLKIFDLGFDSEQPCYPYFIGVPHSSNVYAEVFETLPSLKNLSTLLINCESMMENVFTPHTLIPNLLYLAIKASQCRTIIPILLLTPNLKTLSIFVGGMMVQDMNELGSALFHCPSLRNLEVSVYRIMPSTSHSATSPNSPNKPIMLDFVRPLKGLSLESLILDCHTLGEIEVSHGVICEIGRSFPKLRKLHLFSPALATGSSFVLTNIGMSMARLCPNLVEFEVCCPLPVVPSPGPLILSAIENTFEIAL